MEHYYPLLVAENLSYDDLKQRAVTEYFSAGNHGETPMLCHVTPAGKLVDYMGKPLRKTGKYDYYEFSPISEAAYQKLLDKVEGMAYNKDINKIEN